MTDALPADDPKPVEPERPGPDHCCHSGCTWCVQDVYEDAMERYRAELAAWQARHPDKVQNRGEGSVPAFEHEPICTLVQAVSEGRN